MNAAFDCSSVASFPSNPDITGIGVRIAMYISNFLVFFMAWLDPKDMDGIRDAARTSYVVSISMLIAAFVSRFGSLGLSLVDGQIVTLLNLLVASMLVPHEMIDWGYETGFVRSAYLALSGIFGILVYYDVDHFGGSAYLPQCKPNDEFVFVIFSARISATNEGLRIFSLLYFSILLIVFGFTVWKPALITLIRLAKCFSNDERWPKYLEVVRKRIWPDREEWTVEWHNLAVFIYIVVTVEEMISWNGLDAQGIINQWSFGQTMAIVMVLDLVLKVMAKLRAKEVEGEATLAVASQRTMDSIEAVWDVLPDSGFERTRLAVHSLVLALSVVVLGISANLVAKHGAFVLADFALALSAITIFLFFQNVMQDLNGDYSRFTVSFFTAELTWVLVLWILWLALAAYAVSVGAAREDCSNVAHYQGSDLGSFCRQVRVLVGVPFANWIILLAYRLYLLAVGHLHSDTVSWT